MKLCEKRTFKHTVCGSVVSAGEGVSAPRCELFVNESVCNPAGSHGGAGAVEARVLPRASIKAVSAGKPLTAASA